MLCFSSLPYRMLDEDTYLSILCSSTALGTMPPTSPKRAGTQLFVKSHTILEIIYLFFFKGRIERQFSVSLPFLIHTNIHWIDRVTPDSGERHFQNDSSYVLKNLLALNAINWVVGATMEYRIKGHDSILKHPLVWRHSGIIIRPLNKLECWETFPALQLPLMGWVTSAKNSVLKS